MTIEDHICKLLESNNSVSIPELGILMAQTSFSSIHPTQHQFSPPSISFLFKHVQTDHTMLTDAIMNDRKISNDEATKLLKVFTEIIMKTLAEKGAYEMKGVGRFYFDVEKNLKFISQNNINYQQLSYGLPEFFSPAILRPENISSYAAAPQSKEKKKSKINWFRF